jgi:hypothetical protein
VQTQETGIHRLEHEENKSEEQVSENNRNISEEKAAAEHQETQEAKQTACSNKTVRHCGPDPEEQITDGDPCTTSNKGSKELRRIQFTTPDGKSMTLILNELEDMVTVVPSVVTRLPTVVSIRSYKDEKTTTHAGKSTDGEKKPKKYKDAEQCLIFD